MNETTPPATQTEQHEQLRVETGHDIGANCAAAAELFPQHTKHRTK